MYVVLSLGQEHNHDHCQQQKLQEFFVKYIVHILGQSTNHRHHNHFIKCQEHMSTAKWDDAHIMLLVEYRESICKYKCLCQL